MAWVYQAIVAEIFYEIEISVKPIRLTDTFLRQTKYQFNDKLL